MIPFIRHIIDNRILYPLLLHTIKKTDTVMDIGSGDNPQTVFKPRIMYCIDPTYETEGNKICGTWDDAVAFMKDVSINTVFLMDVIEHLPKEEGIRLLKETEQLVKDQIVVFTLLGYMEQDDGKYNSHLSGWLPEDFGNGWHAVVLPYFHWVDFKNKPLSKPQGAILAVYTK